MKGGRGLWLAAGLSAVVVLLGACGSDNDETTTGETAAPAVTAAAAAATASAPTSAPAAAQPTTPSRTFTDDAGKTLTIAEPPKRVVALSPSIVEVMYAVGAPPAARVSSARYPQPANALPAVGSSYQPNLEQIAQQTPDLIVVDTQIQSPQTVGELAKLGAPIFSLRLQTVDDVTKALRTVGRLMGKNEEGEQAAKGIEAKLAAVQAKLPPEAERPKVLVMVGTADAFWAAKPDSFAGDVMKRLGARNLVSGGPDTTQFPGFTTYSLEQIAQIDPDAIFVISAVPNGPPTSRQLASNPAWSSLRAVKAGRVYEAPAETLVQSAGPRVGEAIDLIAPQLYPGKF